MMRMRRRMRKWRKEATTTTRRARLCDGLCTSPMPRVVLKQTPSLVKAKEAGDPLPAIAMEDALGFTREELRQARLLQLGPIVMNHHEPVDAVTEMASNISVYIPAIRAEGATEPEVILDEQRRTDLENFLRRIPSERELLPYRRAGMSTDFTPHSVWDRRINEGKIIFYLIYKNFVLKKYLHIFFLFSHKTRCYQYSTRA